MSFKTSWTIKKTLNESANTEETNPYRANIALPGWENGKDAACAECFQAKMVATSLAVFPHSII
jgi:hypothetical protein